jgi:hypothetical protein
MFCANKFNDMQRHLNKKNSCKKSLEAYNYSDDELLILSLLPQNEDIEHIKNEISYLKKSNIIYKNKDILFNDINLIDKNKSKKCIYCNEFFDKIKDLKKHILIKCFVNDLHKKNSIPTLNINSDISVNNNSNNINITTNNTINNTTNITTNNITNIYLEIKSPIPFDSEWNLSHIDTIKKEHLSFSKFMYSKLLEEILKNEINLNVIIDKDNNSGIVYKNNIDKYIKMKSKDILDNTMLKLNKHLLDINKSLKDDIIDELIDKGKNIIKNKYNNYKNNEDIKKNVTDIISNIYEEKKEDAINMSNNIIKNSNNDGY